jgi:hypothetical protein
VIRRHAINNMLIARVSDIFNATWYTGEKTVGVRKGTILAAQPPTPAIPVTEIGELSNKEEIDAADEVDDEEERDIDGVISYVANSSI